MFRKIRQIKTLQIDDTITLTNFLGDKLNYYTYSGIGFEITSKFDNDRGSGGGLLFFLLLMMSCLGYKIMILTICSCFMNDKG